MKTAVTRLSLGAVAIITMAGCTPTESGTTSQEAVSFGNEGSIHGGYTVVITPEDRAVIRRRTGADPIVETVLTLEVGSFEQVRTAASGIIDGAPAKLDVVSPCLDAGSDFITLTDASGISSGWDAGCTEDALQAGIKMLSDLLRDSTVQ